MWSTAVMLRGSRRSVGYTVLMNPVPPLNITRVVAKTPTTIDPLIREANTHNKPTSAGLRRAIGVTRAEGRGAPAVTRVAA